MPCLAYTGRDRRIVSMDLKDAAGIEGLDQQLCWSADVSSYRELELRGRLESRAGGVRPTRHDTGAISALGRWASG